jgi:hypothetical protein
VDIGLLADPAQPGREMGALPALAGELADAAGLRPEDLDVRLVNGADPVFLGSLLRDGRLLFEADRETRIRFETRALSLWLDFRPAWERVRTAALGRWSGG